VTSNPWRASWSDRWPGLHPTSRTWAPAGGDGRDVGGDALDERAEQELAQGVVDAGIANEDASRHPVSLGGMAAAVSQDGDGYGGRSGQDHQLPRSGHQASAG
jgi:hypothetical protein